jgi:hypothetical protein
VLLVAVASVAAAEVEVAVASAVAGASGGKGNLIAKLILGVKHRIVARDNLDNA